MEVQDWLGKDNQLGIDIWNKKYRYNNETFEEWLDRVSNGDEKLKDLIREKKFLFGGRILANRGLQKDGKKITYSNCYVITPPEDNIESIYEVAAKLARTYSYGGGCGVDISNLAPRGAKVNNAAKETSGAVSFMDTYSQVTEQIGQNGRRGALMISLDCSHPDLIEFMDVKRDLTKVTKANISVRFSDDFMLAVKENRDFTLTFTRPESHEIIEKTVNARDTFLRLAKNNWQMAEPGCLFWNNITDWNLVSEDPNFTYAGTNPCAEEPLPAGGSCLLGSLNLAAFVDENGTFQLEDFAEAVSYSVIALNNVLEEGLPLHPLEEQRESVANWRQIGLGIMGLADALIKMGITYGSEDALAMCDNIGNLMAMTAIFTSSELGVARGPYTKYNKEAVSKSRYFTSHIDEEEREKVLNRGLRNSQILTIAPTGSISTMLGISGGIEPIYANSYTRKTESLHGEDKYYKVYTPIVQEYIDKHGCKEEDLPKYFITAKDLNYKQRIDMQSVWQKHIDASISSTVNVPNEFSIMDTFNLYIYAWERGLKGVTIYRDGCERTGILSTSETEDSNELKRGEVIKTDDNSIGKERHLTTGCGSLHCQAYFNEDGELVETYLSKGSTGGCNSFMVALSRMISLAARGGISKEDIIDQLMSTPPCVSYCNRRVTKKDTSKGTSCPMAVAYALQSMMGQEIKLSKKEEKVKQEEPKNTPKCPECGGELIFEGGCNSCKTCGWTKCD